MTDSPSLAELIKGAIEARLAEVHVAMPGIVQKYDPQTQIADIQPAQKRKYANGEVTNLPLITNVPVVYPRSGVAYLHIPVEQNDTVLLVFSERSLDNFLQNGGVQDPDDHRKHHLTDAIAIPGLFTKQNPIKGKAGVVELVNGKSALRMDKGGKIYLGNEDTTAPAEPVPLGLVLKKYLEDIHAQLTQLTNTLKTVPAGVTTGPGNPTGINPAFATQITTIGTALDALKSSPISDKKFLSDIFFTEKGG